MLLDETFSVRPCSPHVGVEISGIDFTTIHNATAASIKALLCAHGIVLIRNQRIEPAARLKDYTRRFGELGLHHQFTLDGHPEIVKLSNIIENGAPFGLKDAGHHWHSDLSYSELPEFGAVLHAREIPAPHANGESAGDTLFANAQTAYDRLDDAMKRRLAGLRASFSRSKLATGSARSILPDEERRKLGEVLHPVVRTHPVTGRKCIYVNPGHTRYIAGLPQEESTALLDQLCKQVQQPDLVYRHQWQVGDVIMWDNCVVQHNAIPDYALPQRRLILRTTIKGTAPF